VQTVTICLINQKGGCGKSSTCFHLGGHLAETGFRVLLIDADPQGSLSQAFVGSTAVENLTVRDTLAVLFHDESCLPNPESLPAATRFQRLSVVRANQTLAPHNTPSPHETGLKQQALRVFLDALDAYDMVLIDCPPNLYQCSWTAMLAADFVLVPVPPEDFGTQGLRVVHEAVATAKRFNPQLELVGHLVTRFDGRLLLHQSYEKKLRQLYGESVLKTVIPEASAFKVAVACREPVTFYAPRSKAAGAIRALGDEIRWRIDHITADRDVA